MNALDNAALEVLAALADDLDRIGNKAHESKARQVEVMRKCWSASPAIKALAAALIAVCQERDALRKRVEAADALADAANSFCENGFELIPMLNAIAAYRATVQP